MNRAKRHMYLVMYEKIDKQSKRDFQRILARKNIPCAASINALGKILNKAISNNALATMKVLLESVMEASK